LKKLEIKSFGVFSAAKTTLYLMIIPMALLVVIGFFALLIGVLISQAEVALFGGMYMVMSVIVLVFYGVISMLVALIYNWLAGKFGGLEITVTEITPERTPDVQLISSPDTNSAAITSEAPNPEAPNPEAPNPEAPNPEAPNPEAPNPEAPNPEAPNPEAPNPEAPSTEDNSNK
jgi:hypothetical protein